MNVTLATRVISGVPTLIYKLDGQRMIIQGAFPEGAPYNERWDQETDGIAGVFLESLDYTLDAPPTPRTSLPRRLWAALRNEEAR